MERDLDCGHGCGIGVAMKLFVWESGLSGPVPAIYHDGLPVDCATGKQRVEVLQMVKIPRHLDYMKLHQLEKLFPYKEAA